MPTLTRSILESHRPGRLADEPRPALPGSTVDHVLFGGEVAPFALPLVLRPGGAPGERVFAWAGRELPSPAHPGGEALRSMLGHAHRVGARVARAVHGTCEPLYLATAAAPGRLAVSAGAGELACGALGMLALRVGGIEAAAIAAGLPLDLDARPVIGVVLSGSPPPSVEGTDVALDVAARLATVLTGGFIEVTGEGVAALTMADRIAFARTLSGFGARAVVFPSDERTRGFLRRCGRDPVWREIAAPDPEEYETRLAVDLADAEPFVGVADDAARTRPLRRLMGRRVSRVVIGPLADEAELRGFAAALGDARVVEGTEVVIAAGSLRGWESLERTGTLERLKHAGVVLVDPNAPFDMTHAPGPAGGEWLALGVPVSVSSTVPGSVLLANVHALAAAARTGEVNHPRERSAEAVTPADDAPVPAAAGEWLPALETDTEVPPPALAEPLGPPRAVIRLDLTDGFEAGRLLPRGARRGGEDDGGDPIESFLAPEFAAAVAPRGPACVVAGRGFGGGERADEAAWALARSRIVAVAALSYGPGAAVALAHAGVLALLRTAGTASRLRLGDELEFSGLPHRLEPGRRVGLRNLTRGVSIALAHAWAAREVEVWRAGGILARAEAVLAAAGGR